MSWNEIDRVVVLADGRRVHAVQPGPLDPWTVWVDGDRAGGRSARWLLWVLTELFETGRGKAPDWVFALSDRIAGFETPLGLRFRCPCCDFLTYAKQDSSCGCPVCQWEDDLVQYRDPDYRGGANRESLREARANFALFGASAARRSARVRPALLAEFPPGMEADGRPDIPVASWNGAVRSAALWDGRLLYAMQPGPLDPWTVWVDEDRDREQSGRWLAGVVEHVLQSGPDEGSDWVSALVDALTGVDTPSGRRFPCPCCDFLTFDIPPLGSFRICGVCRWQADRVQYEEPDRPAGGHSPGRAGVNSRSLGEAREHYAAAGVSDARFAQLRSPLPHEFPPEPTTVAPTADGSTMPTATKASTKHPSTP